MPLLYPRAKSVFDPPTVLDQLLSSPLKFLVFRMYHILLWLRGPAYHPPAPEDALRIVCLSDTHCQKPAFVPDGDILIHAGDLTKAGTVDEIQEQLDWLNSLPHSEKVFIAGNHDSYFDIKSRRREDKDKTLKLGKLHYLCRSAITLRVKAASGKTRTLNIYGAPQIPLCGGSDFAFQHNRNDDTWKGRIPMETDILVTHTPPKYHLDLSSASALGDKYLLEEIWRVRPSLHVFAHIHAGSGEEVVYWDEAQKAYERAMARRGVLIEEAFGIFALLEGLQLLWYGLQGILWSKFWGGGGHGSLMVNAALMNDQSGGLDRPVRTLTF